MRTFGQIEEDHDLYRWGRGAVGQFYLPREESLRKQLIRHFDTERVAGLVQPYADIITALDRWIAERPDVAELVEVLALTEIGVDFVARPFIPYMYALDGYDEPEEWDLVEVIPEELEPMRKRVQGHLATGLTGRDQILQEIVTASLLGPSPSTVMGRERWLVVSPSLTLEQVERWAAEP